MQEIATIGIDLAKGVLQLHGIDAIGQVVLRRKLRRGEVLRFFEDLPGRLIGMEACVSAHHCARKLTAIGHEVKLMLAAYVKLYVKSQKNDAADAEAICEAVQRPTMRFVAVKGEDQQAALMLHRARDLLVRQQIMLITVLRAHLAEFRVMARLGSMGVRDLVALIRDGDRTDVPELAREALLPLCDQLSDVRKRIEDMGHRILRWHRSNVLSQRLETIPGVGPITASAHGFFRS